MQTNYEIYMVEVSRRVVKSEGELFYTEISLLRIKKSF